MHNRENIWFKYFTVLLMMLLGFGLNFVFAIFFAEQWNVIYQLLAGFLGAGTTS